MKYYSTRDGSNDDSNVVDFEKALFSAYTSDGGLYVPRLLPRIDWTQWRDFEYPRIVSELLRLFVDDDRINIEEIVTNAYGDQKFDCEEIVPIVRLDNNDGRIFVMELFHGPTWSFKDYAMQILGQLLRAYLKINGKRLTLVIVTSGDTGSAAIEAVKNCPQIDVIVLLPKGLVSEIQERQMTSVMAENVHVIPGEGDSGDLDTALRVLFEDTEFIRSYNVGSINSINWARIMVQMAHWFYSYFRVMERTGGRIGETLRVAIPTGAAGNLGAALYARKLGLTIDIAACNNENNTIHRWIETGRLGRVDFRATEACAMDIDTPYNIERVIHCLSYEDESNVERTAKLCREMMEKFYANDGIQTDSILIRKLREAIRTCSISDDQIRATIKKIREEASYVCCPHTATAVWYARENAETKRPILCAATASPYKFLDTLHRSGVDLEPDDRLRRLMQSKTRTRGVLRKGDDWVAKLKEKIIKLNSQ